MLQTLGAHLLFMYVHGHGLSPGISFISNQIFQPIMIYSEREIESTSIILRERNQLVAKENRLSPRR